MNFPTSQPLHANCVTSMAKEVLEISDGFSWEHELWQDSCIAQSHTAGENLAKFESHPLTFGRAPAGDRASVCHGQGRLPHTPPVAGNLAAKRTEFVLAPRGNLRRV